jgi:phosphoenolpyruvate carboxykinase (ATP)
VLVPSNTWASKDEYDRAARSLAEQFVSNFAQYADDVDAEIVKAGPVGS